MIIVIELKTKTFWRATIALGIASFFIFANVYFTQPLLPVFSKEFAISPVVSSLSVSLVLLTLGCSFFMYSGISDRYGRKNVMIVVMIVATMVSFVIPLSTSYEMLLVLRILQAVALAGIPTIAMSYIGEEFAMRALTLAIGIHISANTIGGMGGRVIGGVITDWFNWQTAFFVMGIVSLICLVLFIFLLPKSNHFQKRPFNLKVRAKTIGKAKVLKLSENVALLDTNNIEDLAEGWVVLTKVDKEETEDKKGGNEDKIVKEKFKYFAKKEVLKIITKKPLTASEGEISVNPRSRSAKLRVAERI